MYKGEADWTHIAEMKNNPRMHIPILGNGDVDTPQKALEYKNRYGVDGVMIGRAAIGYPWIFNEIKHFIKTGNHLPAPTLEDRVKAARGHLEMAIKRKGTMLGILETRRHYSNYFKGLPHFRDYRTRLVTLENEQELFAVFEEILEAFSTHQFA